MCFGRMSYKPPGPQRQPRGADRDRGDSARVNSRERTSRRCRCSASRLAIGVICLSPLLGAAEHGDGDSDRRHAADGRVSDVEAVAAASSSSAVDRNSPRALASQPSPRASRSTATVVAPKALKADGTATNKPPPAVTAATSRPVGQVAYPIMPPVVVDYRDDLPSRLRRAGKLIGPVPLGSFATEGGIAAGTPCGGNNCTQCCTFAIECDDNDPCTSDICQNHSCVRVPIPNCRQAAPPPPEPGWRRLLRSRHRKQNRGERTRRLWSIHHSSSWS